MSLKQLCLNALLSSSANISILPKHLQDCIYVLRERQNFANMHLICSQIQTRIYFYEIWEQEGEDDIFRKTFAIVQFRHVKIRDKNKFLYYDIVSGKWGFRKKNNNNNTNAWIFPTCNIFTCIRECIHKFLFEPVFNMIM